MKVSGKQTKAPLVMSSILGGEDMKKCEDFCYIGPSKILVIFLQGLCKILGDHKI